MREDGTDVVNIGSEGDADVSKLGTCAHDPLLLVEGC